jgi:FkbM family methyltransferase
MRFGIRFGIARFLSKITYKTKCAKFIMPIAHIILPKFKQDTVCPTMYDDIVMYITTNDRSVGGTIYYRGVYEYGTVLTLKKYLREGMVFYDVGANIGFFSCIASRIVGNNGYVYSFEPNSIAFRFLEKNIALNDLINSDIFNIAVGSKKEIKSFVRYDDTAFGHIDDPKIIATIKPVGKSLIQVDTLDNMIRDGDLRPPDFIKVDVEGSEFNVLKGAAKALSEHHPVICFEFSYLGKKIVKFLIDLDYRIYVLEDKIRSGKLTIYDDQQSVPGHGDNLVAIWRKKNDVL